MNDNNTNSTKTTDFFDFKTGGIAYLNRIREVSPKKGKPFMAVTCAILNGHKDDISYVYVDCNVVGTKAIEQIKWLAKNTQQGDKILANVLIGDLWADPYMQHGEAKAALKGRLLMLENVKLNGQLLTSKKGQASESDACVDGASLEAKQPVQLPQINYLHDLWPVTQSVQLDPNDGLYQVKLRKLIGFGYEYDPEQHVCQVIEDTEADKNRKSRLFELQQRSAVHSETQAKAVNA